MNHTETGRSELFAILHGFHTLVEKLKENTYLDCIREEMPNVLVLSDRKDVVDSANGIAKRNVNKDLWAAYDWFTQYFDINCIHIPRDTIAPHKIVDALASELRLVLIDFTEAQKDAKII